MRMCPVSRGSRRASNALRGNSGSSSRNSTPCVASEISPGRGGEPPPTKATALAVWWGAQVGRWPQCSSRKRPLSEATAALSSASAVLMAGNSPAKRCASMDFPDPGGPTSSRLCPPAAAISSARRAAAWPFTSAKSGPVGMTLAGARGCRRSQPSGSGGVESLVWPVGANWRTTSNKCRARYTRTPSTSAASSALPGGSTHCVGVLARVPSVGADRLMASAPRMGRSSPPSDNSPANS